MKDKKDCHGCVWSSVCSTRKANNGERCEHFYPVDGDEVAASREYKQDLREREADYAEFLEEQESLREPPEEELVVEPEWEPEEDELD